jgi:hypothetical protein
MFCLLLSDTVQYISGSCSWVEVGDEEHAELCLNSLFIFFFIYLTITTHSILNDTFNLCELFIYLLFLFVVVTAAGRKSHRS